MDALNHSKESSKESNLELSATVGKAIAGVKNQQRLEELGWQPTEMHYCVKKSTK